MALPSPNTLCVDRSVERPPPIGSSALKNISELLPQALPTLWLSALQVVGICWMYTDGAG